MFAAAEASAMVRDLRRRLGADAVALVRRDGQLLAADLPNGGYPETFAILTATVLGAASAAAREAGGGLPDRVVFEGPDARGVVARCGATALLAVLLPLASPAQDVLGEIARFAEALAPHV